MTSVNLNSVSKAFGRVEAVSEASIDLTSRTLTALVGPSGAGKSTVLRLIAGLEIPNNGTIKFGDRDITKISPERRDVGMVFQQFALYERMSVGDNLAYPLRSRIPNRRERMRRVAETADLLSITDLLPRRAGQLSGGQKQRVALGRAIVRRPPILLMDEPFSNVDPFLRRTIRQELGSLLQYLQLTTVLVTHSLEDAYEMASHIAIMQEGKVVQAGPIRETYDYPGSVTVAELTSLDGTTSFPCRVEANTLYVAGVAIRLQRPAPFSLGTVIIRSDAWRLGLSGGGMRIPVDVRAVKWAGGRYRVSVASVPDPNTEWTVYLSGFRALGPGERTLISTFSHDMHIFDSNGVRIDTALVADERRG